jgi:hypothetical protein
MEGKMKYFEEAQKLFSDYEKSRRLDDLRGSLTILDVIIEDQREDTERAKRFKERILTYIHSEIKEICSKGNIIEFGAFKGDIDKFNEVLFASLDEDDRERLIGLTDISIHIHRDREGLILETDKK